MPPLHFIVCFGYSFWDSISDWILLVSCMFYKTGENRSVFTVNRKLVRLDFGVLVKTEPITVATVYGPVFSGFKN
jgi:hypothetical protein